MADVPSNTPATPNNTSGGRELNALGWGLVAGGGAGAGYLAYKIAGSPLVGIGVGLLAAWGLKAPVQNFSIK